MYHSAEPLRGPGLTQVLEGMEVFSRPPKHPTTNLFTAWLLGVPIGLATWGFLLGIWEQRQLTVGLEYMGGILGYFVPGYAISFPVVLVVLVLLQVLIRIKLAGPAAALGVALLPALLSGIVQGFSAEFTQVSFVVGLATGLIFCRFAYHGPAL